MGTRKVILTVGSPYLDFLPAPILAPPLVDLTCSIVAKLIII